MLGSQGHSANGSTVNLVNLSSNSYPANLLPQESTDFGTSTFRSSERKRSLSNVNYEDSLIPIKPTFTPDMSSSTNNPRAVNYSQDVSIMDRPRGVIRIDTRNYDNRQAGKEGRKITGGATAIPNPQKVDGSYHIGGPRYAPVRNNDNQKLLKSTVLVPDSPDSSTIDAVPFPPPPLKFTHIQSTFEGSTSTKPLMQNTARRQPSTVFGVDGTKHIFPKSAIRKSNMGFDANADPTRLGTLPFGKPRTGGADNKASTGELVTSALPPSYQNIVKNSVRTAPSDTKAGILENGAKDNAVCPELENVRKLAKTPLSKWKNKTWWPKPKLLYVILLLMFLLVISVALMIYFATNKRGIINGQEIPLSIPSPSTKASVPSSTGERILSITPIETPCLTEDCIKVAADIINKMNRSADPCEGILYKMRAILEWNGSLYRDCAESPSSRS